MREMKEILKRVGVLALSVMLAVVSSNLTTVAAEPGADATTPAETSAAAQSDTDPAIASASVTESETESEEGTAEESEEEEETTEVEEETEDEEKEEPTSAFSETAEIDGVTISVTAAEGVFPEGATLSVSKAEAAEEAAAESAVDNVRSNNKNVAASYTYDIKVLDKDGNEIQPADSDKVKISFTLSEVADSNLSTDIYHIKEDAEALSVSESGSTATAETDGFSLYTVEFTYTDKQYVLPGDSEVALADILEAVELFGEVTDVSVSDDTLFFAAKNNRDEWIVTAHKAFDSEEWMKVTIDDVEYEITVTDDQLPAAKIGETEYPTIPEAITAATTGDTIVILRDVDISAPLVFPEGKTLTLDLNGHTIDRGLANGSAVENGNVITVNGNLTLKDSGTNGTIEGGSAISGGGVYVKGEGHFTMQGGTITHCSAHYGGGVFVSADGYFTMQGGSITGCILADSSGKGGGVFIKSDGTFYVSDAPVINSNNQSSNNVFLDTPEKIKIIGALSPSAQIYVNAGSGTTVATAGNNYALQASDAAAFYSDSNENLSGVLDNNNIKLGSPWISLQNMLNAGGTVTLNRDYTAGSGNSALVVPTRKTVTLDLNGHTIDRGLANGSAVEDGNVITVEGELTINDSSESGTGRLTGGNNDGNGGGVIVNDSDAVFTLNGSSITGCISGVDYGHGGGVAVENGRFIMNGGSIDHCTGIQGGGVYVAVGTFDMNGGTISENTGSEVGGVFVESYNETDEGFFNMNGGTISGNTGGKTGGVDVYYGRFSMAAGTISGNSATDNDAYGGGVHIRYGTIAVKGTPVIKSNTKNGGASNVVFKSNCSDKTIKVTDELGTGAEIHVNAASGVTVAQGSNYTPTASDAAAFYSDSSEDLAGVLNNNNIEIGSAWSSLQSMLETGGTVTLTRDYTAGSSDSALVVPEDKTVTLDLNDHYILYKGDTASPVITVNGSLTLKDSKTTGRTTRYVTLTEGRATGVSDSGTPGADCIEVTGGFIAGGNNVSKNGGGVYVEERCMFTMEGGTIAGCKAGNGGGVNVNNSGMFTMEDGTIVGCKALYDGGGVFINNTGNFNMNGGSIKNCTATGSGFYRGGGSVYVSSSGKFNMEGGSITDCTADSGGGVYMHSGNFKMNGGSITDCTATSQGGGVYVFGGTFKVSGTPVIRDNKKGSDANNVALNNSKYITVTGALTTGAEIRVSTNENDTFAAGLGYDITEADAAYFHNDSDESLVAVLRNGGIKFEQAYTISVYPSMYNGTIETSSTTAVAGATVTLTITPDSGYVLDTLTVTDENSESITVRGTGNTRTFTMPAGDVMVDASFAEAVAQVGDVKYATVQGAIDAAPANGTVTLLSDVDINSALIIDSNKSVTLDLAGHTIDRGLTNGSVSQDGNVITVQGKLTLTDSSVDQTGTITGGKTDLNRAGGVNITYTGEFILQGGSIKNNVGMGVYVYGTFTMIGGSICGNSGQGVYVFDGKVFTMSGGSITGNTGGGVYLANNSSGSTPGVLKVSGTPVIESNTQNNTTKNIYFGNDFSNDEVGIIIIGSLESGAKLCASPNDGVPVATGSNDHTLVESDVAYFHSDASNYTPALSSDGRSIVFKTTATVETPPVGVSSLIYNGSAHSLVTEAGVTGGTAKYAVTSSDGTTEPAGLSYSTSIPTETNAGDYYIWYYVEGNDYHSDSEHVRLDQPVTIAQKPATITASAQSVEVNGTIVQDVSKATLTGAVSGHTLNGVTLTASSTSAITEQGTITPSDAVVKDASGNDVTSNYDITYTAGTLAVTSPQVYIDGITAESREYNGLTDATLSGTPVIKKVRDDAVVTGLGAESIEAAFADANAGNNKAVSISSATLTGEGAGNYTLNIDKTNEKLNLKANITKATPNIGEVTAEALNDSTDSSGVVLTRTVTTVSGTLALTSTSLRYGINENCTWRFTPTDTTNYETITGTVDVTVNDTLAPTGEVSIKESAWSTFLNTVTFGWYKLTDKVRITAADSGTGVDKVYYFIHESETALSQEAVTAKEDSDWTEYSSPIAIDHDTRCIVYAKIVDKANHTTYISSNGLAFDSTAPTISGATDGASYVYGNDISLTVTDSGELDTVKINGVTKTSSETIQDAGSYTVTATDKAGNTSTIAFTITKAPITVGASIEGWTYGGNASTPVVSGNSGNGTVTYEYKVQGTADNTYSSTVPVNHGDYTLRATVAATDNYQGGSATADFSIAKADTTLSQAPAAVSDLLYTGSLQELLTAGTVTGGTIQYKLGASGTYVTSVPKARDAGSYTVYYKVVGDQNHNDIAETSVVVSIAQQTTSITTTPVSKHYGDSAFAITGVTNNVGATPTYAVTAGTDVISISGSTVTILKPGSATITASIPVSTNYTAATSTIAVTVANGAQPAQPAATMTTAFANDTVSKVSLPTGWTWADEDRDTALTVGTAFTAHAEYTAADATYYEGGKALDITITRQAHPATTTSDASSSSDDTDESTATGTAASTVITSAASTANKPAAVNRNSGNDGIAGSRTESSLFHVQGHDEATSWNDVESVIKESNKTTAEEKTLIIKLDRAAKIPATVFETAKGTDVTLVFDMGDGIRWSVKGTDITDSAAASMSFGVTRNSHNIPNEIAGALAGDHFSTQISLDFDGPFGFTATLTLDMGSENAGKIANLFYFNPDSNNLEFIYAGEIGTDGNADLEFNHASDYLIVVADESMEAAALDVSAGKLETPSGDTETQTGDAAVTAETAKNGLNPIWIILLAVVVIAVGAGAALIRKKADK